MAKAYKHAQLSEGLIADEQNNNYCCFKSCELIIFKTTIDMKDVKTCINDAEEKMDMALIHLEDSFGTNLGCSCGVNSSSNCSNVIELFL